MHRPWLANTLRPEPAFPFAGAPHDPLHLLAHQDDLQTAAAVFAANPALADDADAPGSAASDAFVRLMLRHQPDLPRRLTVATSVKAG